MNTERTNKQAKIPISLQLDVVWDFLGTAFVAGLAWWFTSRVSYTDDLIFTVQHLGFILVSLGDAWAPIVACVDIIFCVMWCCSVCSTRLGCYKLLSALWCRAFFTILNRQAAYVVGLGVWGTIILSFAESVWPLAMGVALILFVVPGIINWGTYWLLRSMEQSNNEIQSPIEWKQILFHRRPFLNIAKGMQSPIDWKQILFYRRPFLNTVTGVGLVVLIVCYPFPKGGLAFLTVTTLITTSLRITVGFFYSNYDPQKGESSEDVKSRGELWVIAQDAPMIILALVFMLVPFAVNISKEDEATKSAMNTRVNDSYSHKNKACPSTSGTATNSEIDVESWDASLFLVADNQFRTLHGKSSTGHSATIDTVVPVAQRPIELDLLSGVTLEHFGRVFRQLRSHGEENLKWAHLGDFADLGCKSELGRLDSVVKYFGQENLVGIAPGNHDNFFTGNFSWHPDWSEDVACPGGPLSHDYTNEQMVARTPPLVKDAKLKRFSSHPSEDGFLATIVELEPQIVAVFLDTSDYDLVWLGVAGVLGYVSNDQADWVITKLKEHFSEAYVILLAHHPYESIYQDVSPFSDGGINRIFGWLTEKRCPKGRCLIAFVAAHTHLSQFRKTEWNGQEIKQFIVGSTTDAPQEAAILRVRIRGGPPEIRFETIPAVSEKGVSPCGIPSVSASCCECVLKEIAECRKKELPELKVDLQEESERWQKCAKDGERFPSRRIENQKRAWALLKCITKEQPPDCPLDEKNIFDRFHGTDEACCTDEKWEPQARETEHANRLVCLSWAASILQQKKHDGWDFEDALNLVHTTLSEHPPWYFDSSSEDQKEPPRSSSIKKE